MARQGGNRLQTWMSLALSSLWATIGRTLVVAGVTILHGNPLTLGLSAKQELLLALTLIVPLLTLGTGRVTGHRPPWLYFAVFSLFAAAPSILRLAARAAGFFDPKTLFVYVSPFARPFVSRRSSIRYCRWPRGNGSFTRESLFRGIFHLHERGKDRSE